MVGTKLTRGWAKNNIGNGEGKVLIRTTHRHELMWRNAGEKWGAGRGEEKNGTTVIA